MRTIHALLAALALVGLVGSSTAAELPSSQVMLSTTPEELARVIRELGYEAEVQTHEKGARRVRVRTVTSHYFIYFYGCDPRNNCRSIGMTAYFENKRQNAVQFVNDWNRDKRFAKAYVDKEKALRLEYDINFEHGVTVGNVKATIDVFMDQFAEFLGAMQK